MLQLFDSQAISGHRGYADRGDSRKAAQGDRPSHRERVFCIGFLDEGGDGKDDFLFPAPIKLEKAVYDYLDDLTPGVRVLTARERISLMGFPKTFAACRELQFLHHGGFGYVHKAAAGG